MLFGLTKCFLCEEPVVSMSRRTEVHDLEPYQRPGTPAVGLNAERMCSLPRPKKHRRRVAGGVELFFESVKPLAALHTATHRHTPHHTKTP